MNYKEIYETLCKRGQTRVLDVYTEKHHIVPRCLGGSDNKNNITILTPREHYLAHYMLTKIYTENYKLLHAFSMMAVINRKQSRTYNARQYAKMAEAKSTAMKLNNPSKNGVWNKGRKGLKTRKTPLSDSERKMHSERMTKNNPNTDGLRWRKPVLVTCISTGQEHKFDALGEAEQEMRIITGEVINHNSVWRHMKSSSPYKGYRWAFERDKDNK
jgi:hypothetical protein